MGERVSRQVDEKVYQPRIHSSLIHEIYKISEMTGLPMTVIVDKAIREYLGKYETTNSKNSQTIYPEP